MRKAIQGFQSPLGEVVKETNSNPDRLISRALLFQSPLGEVVKETMTGPDMGSAQNRFNPLSGKW